MWNWTALTNIPLGVTARLNEVARGVHLGTATILKGSNSISPETCCQVAYCRYHHPERMESISPGLRGTSYPGFTATDAGYPERVVSNSSARPGGSVKMHPSEGNDGRGVGSLSQPRLLA